MLGISTGVAGADGLVLSAPAGEWVGRSVTLVGALPPSRDQTMPISHSAATELAQLLNGASAGELIPELVRQGLQALIEAEAAAAIGADRHERTAQRRGHRNGSRDRLLATPAGDIQLRIPRFRTGSFFPSLLEPRRRVDRALLPGVNYVGGRFASKTCYPFSLTPGNTGSLLCSSFSSTGYGAAKACSISCSICFSR